METEVFTEPDSTFTGNVRTVTQSEVTFAENLGMVPEPEITFTGNVGIVRALKSPSVAYLKTALGKILPKALSEICEKRPLDPIEELARWLYQWADCELYYYEKAIFAKELQLMALQLEKENATRLARMTALKNETHAIKYLLQNEKAMESLLLRKKAGELRGKGWDYRTAGMTASKMGVDYQTFMADSQRKKSGQPGSDDISFKSASMSSHGRLVGAGKRFGSMSDAERKYKRGFSIDESEMRAESRADRKKKRKSLSGAGGVVLDEEGNVMYDKKGRRSITAGRKSAGIGRASRQQSKLRRMAEGDDILSGAGYDDEYGPDAKLKYGFEVTPVRCNWYLAEPNILVCVHPVLGEMRANIPAVSPLLDTPEWWEVNQYSYEVMYDHEIYSLADPHFDDSVYKHQMVVWAEMEPRDQEEESDDDDI